MNAYIFVGLNNHDRAEIARRIKRSPGEQVDYEPFLTKSITTPDDLINHCCEYYQIRKENLIGPTKMHEVLKPRQICIHAIKKFFPKLMLVEIAKLFNRDHSTIIYNLKIVENMFDTDINWRKEYNQFIKAI